MKLASMYCLALPYSDDFSTTENGIYGDSQPAGWAEYNTDWFVQPGGDYALAWNTAWPGTPEGAARPPFPTALFKSFSLAGITGNYLDATLFVATDFTSQDSFVNLRLRG